MELKQALTAFGYRLSDQCLDQMILSMPKRPGHSNSVLPNRIEFDDFMSICIKLQTITKAFAQFDKDRSGAINIKYEDFIGLVFGLKI